MNSLNWFLILTGIGTYLLGLISGYFNRLYQLLFLTIRIPRSKLAKIYYYLNQNKSYKFCFLESFPNNKIGSIPEIENSFIIYYFIPLWLDISEKYLTAGYNAKEEVCSLTVFRFHKKKLYDLFKQADEIKLDCRTDIDIYISQYGYFRQLNKLTKKKYIEGLYLDNNITKQIDDIVVDFETNKRSKSGVLLYGPPGNGKTSIIKAVACKHDYNIYIPIIRQDMTNDTIISLFGDIPQDEKAIIVLEDFDNLFDGRKPQVIDAKFTFDSILNILDGLYLNLDNKLVFITANDINKIDKALKNRPSRLDYVLKIDNPNLMSRINILSHSSNCQHGWDSICHIAALTDGQNAAIISEIGKRKINYSRLDEEIKEIIASFSEGV